MFSKKGCWTIRIGKNGYRGIIRISDRGCPVTAVAQALTSKKFSMKYESEMAAEAMGLNLNIAHAIMHAADNNRPWQCGEDFGYEGINDQEKKIRKELLSVLGLPMER